ncbi:hypothetical protein [Clostridium ljungdahlii]
MGRIAEHEIKLYPKHKLVKIDGTTVTVETTNTNETKNFDFDAVVVSLGTASNKELVEEIKTAFDKVVLLGDAAKAGRIEAAVGSGYKAAFEL